MPDSLFIPSIDLRVGSLEEYNRIQREKASLQYKKPKARLCITLSREYGCTGYPVAEALRDIMTQRTGEQWVIVDKDVLEEVARRHNLSREILQTLGENNRILHQVLATFSPRWKSNYEYFELLASHIVALAEQGNVIIVGMGGALLTRHIEHSYHFRIFGSDGFKSAKLAKWLHIETEAADKLMRRQQKLRTNYIKDFLNEDINNPTLYDLLFNNDRCSHDKIAQAIVDFVQGVNPTPSCYSGNQ